MFPLHTCIFNHKIPLTVSAKLSACQFNLHLQTSNSFLLFCGIEVVIRIADQRLQHASTSFVLVEFLLWPNVSQTNSTCSGLFACAAHC